MIQKWRQHSTMKGRDFGSGSFPGDGQLPTMAFRSWESHGFLRICRIPDAMICSHPVAEFFR